MKNWELSEICSATDAVKLFWILTHAEQTGGLLQLHV